MVKLEPARRVHLSQAVFDQLLTRIQDGSLRPGERLPGEYDLMRQAGVGRSSVREAIRGLVALGVVETVPGRGGRVVSHTTSPFALLNSKERSIHYLAKWALLDVTEVRECLEGQAAFLAAKRATPPDVAAIERCALEVERDIAQKRIYFRSNIKFHMAIAHASHNALMAESLDHILREARSFRERYIRDSQGRRTALAHRKILNAIRNRKPAQARQAMVNHIRDFAAFIETTDDSVSPEMQSPDTRTRRGSSRSES